MRLQSVVVALNYSLLAHLFVDKKLWIFGDEGENKS
jgi:hypothetical protein